MAKTVRFSAVQQLLAQTPILCCVLCNLFIHRSMCRRLSYTLYNTLREELSFWISRRAQGWFVPQFLFFFCFLEGGGGGGGGISIIIIFLTRWSRQQRRKDLQKIAILCSQPNWTLQISPWVFFFSTCQRNSFSTTITKQKILRSNDKKMTEIVST